MTASWEIGESFSTSPRVEKPQGVEIFYLIIIHFKVHLRIQSNSRVTGGGTAFSS